MANKRNILAQGDRDGACFLYSIANAVTLLTNKPISQAKWNNFTSNIPVRIDDFINGNGTGRFDDNHAIFETIANKLIDILGVPATISSTHNLISAKKLKNEITENSVIVTAISNGSHWVAISDVVNNNVYMACSAEALENLKNYQENTTKNLGRLYNAENTFPNLNIYKN